MTLDAVTGCVPLAPGGWICFGPRMEEVRRDELGVRWCFYCRKRRPFVFVVEAPVEPSYYGPNPSVRCERGHDDGDLFPGRTREWDGP